MHTALKNGAQDPVLIVVFLRGAVDGLNVVVPHGDADYYALRPNIAIAAPGSNPPPLPLPVDVPLIGGSGQVALDLDGFFGFHPSLAALLPIYEAGELAAIQATGNPDSDRSHFSAQKRMEVAGSVVSRTSGGWVGRYLNATALRRRQAVRGVSIGSALDQSLSGAASAIAVQNSADYVLSSQNPEAWRAALPALNVDTGFAFDGVRQQVFAALDLLAEAQPAQIAPDPAAVYPADALGDALKQAAQYVKADMGIDAVTLNSDGWDHHVSENSVLPPVLSSLGNGLAALRTDLGEAWNRTTVVLMSEFGRTVNQNASGGTDHGRANMMMVLGGRVNGGQVYGSWPGLAENQLDPTGDLAITTDYRTVLGEVLTRHMALPASDLGQVFPGFSMPSPLGLIRG